MKPSPIWAYVCDHQAAPSQDATRAAGLRGARHPESTSDGSCEVPGEQSGARTMAGFSGGPRPLRRCPGGQSTWGSTPAGSPPADSTCSTACPVPLLLPPDKDCAPARRPASAHRSRRPKASEGLIGCQRSSRSGSIRFFAAQEWCGRPPAPAPGHVAMTGTCPGTGLMPPEK